jgi:hypothetical protein
MDKRVDMAAVDEDGMGVELIEIPVDAAVSAAGRLARAAESDAVRADLHDALFTPGTRLSSDEGREPATVEQLRDAIGHLRGNAPDEGRRAWADFILGTVFDNLYGVRDVAPALYRSPLAAALVAGDDYLVYEVLRHLGDHSHDRGEMDAVREEWEASAFHAARSGTALAVLNQLILLAQLAREHGDEAGASLLGSEVGRWAEGLGATRLHSQAAAFAGGADPTRDDG